MGASSRSPSPMTMVPRICRSLNALRMASTAAWSAAFSSPRPISRAEAIDAASVSRTASSPMFLSMQSLAVWSQSRKQPLGRARGAAALVDASVHGVAEREHRRVALLVHHVLEADLHARVLHLHRDLQQV